ITHAHGDHYMGLEAFLNKFGGKIGCTPKTHKRLEDSFKAEAFGTDLKDGEILELGDFRIKALYTPGHSSDHVCLYLENEKVLFTGDTILGWGTSIISPPEGNMTGRSDEAGYRHYLSRAWSTHPGKHQRPDQMVSRSSTVAGKTGSGLPGGRVIDAL
ncbi:MAG: MBL fold metallo-hydrolase, partial [Deltaproteobacteria bacterium]|nr:MBL fold metallo-hydrolase [Deltaproteobacteria bacterium]